jgi:CheY-like chemotaxis protein
MLVLAQRIMSQMVALETESAVHAAADHPPHDASSVEMSATRSSSAQHAAACSAVSTLVSYLQDASSAMSRVCDMSDICKAAIAQCAPLMKNRSVSLSFAGRQRSLPLRVLLVDDAALVRRVLERFARNRGYYYLSCSDGESCVRAFEASLRGERSAYSHFDLILMDKDMPTSAPEGSTSAGAWAVNRIRQLSRLQAEVDPGFRWPCIIGNSACTDEDDETWIRFRDELELARREAGKPNSVLVLPEKLSAWSDAFDAEVRRLCGVDDACVADASEAPTVWGKPIRLQMMFRNLITNAIHHGKPSVGEHRVSVSYDIIDRRSRVHPCLMQSDQDDEVARSLSWQLSHDFDRRTQRYVQVMVTDNGPGIDAQRMKLRMQPSSEAGSGAAVQADGSAGAASAVGSPSNFGICLRQIVCPEIAHSHGAMGVHSRIEPLAGCSFVVALPHCTPVARS